jgi:thiosulfate/3-mercaptopyruvate sulfurtransferase
MDSLVSTQWVAGHLGAPDLAIVDSSWFMPASGRGGREEYLSAHIPGARFLDLDEVADRSDPSPHMLPGGEQFAQAMEQLGVGSGDRIVVYDNSPVRTAARGWFTFRHFGAEQVAILDGGFEKWLAEGRPTEAGEPAPRAARWTARPKGDDVVSKRELLDGDSSPILDARGKSRFEGTDPEPRPGLASGHIPGARNLPFGSLYAEDGTLLPPDEIERLFASAGMAKDAPFVASCGSGVTAASLIFAAHRLGNDRARLYDGSWSEWGADPATPKEVGPPSAG